MLTLDWHINGHIIAVTCIVNAGKCPEDDLARRGSHVYRWEHYRVGGPLRDGCVDHDRADGAEALVLAVLEARAAEGEEMNEPNRTPTTQKDWERYADELIARAETAEARLAKAKEFIAFVFHECGDARAERKLKELGMVEVWKGQTSSPPTVFDDERELYFLKPEWADDAD